MTTLSDQEIIEVIAEQLGNEFPGAKGLLNKAKRLYAIMNLKKSLEEIQVDRVREDLERLSA